MRRKLFALLLLTLVSTSAFADGIMGSGTRSDSGGQILGSGSSTEAAPQIGSGAAVGPFMGSGGLVQRLFFPFARAFAHAFAGGQLGSGN